MDCHFDRCVNKHHDAVKLLPAHRMPGCRHVRPGGAVWCDAGITTRTETAGSVSIRLWKSHCNGREQEI